MAYLNDKITQFLMSSKEPSLANLKIEGDLVTSFFDSVDQVGDQALYGFIESMKKDIDIIMSILYNSTNEMGIFFTYLLLMLKKLNPIDHSFTNIMHMCKNLAKEINEDVTNGAPPSSLSQLAHQNFQKDFNKFFVNHLLRNFCSIILEFPNKR
jgi:hypothetical protein